MDALVERKLHCISNSEDTFAVTIQISEPRLQDDRWYNEIALEGLLENTYQVTGVDSFQSMCLAFGFIRNILKKFRDTGGTLLWSDESGELDMDAMFS